MTTNETPSPEIRRMDKQTMSPHDIREVFASLGALPFIGEHGLAHRSREAIATLTSRVAELEGALLNAFDTAVSAELPRVSHLEYDSHEICKHFASKVRERLVSLAKSTGGAR
jgi:hypothetical protein